MERSGGGSSGKSGTQSGGHGKGDWASGASSDRQVSSVGLGTTGGTGLDTRILQLCKVQGISCVASDFDRAVRQWLRNFEKRRGSEFLQEAFDHLAEWCSRR